MPKDQDGISFLFPLTDDVTLINDFVLRREVLEKLPLPMGVVIDGEWVWMNAAAGALNQWVGEWRDAARGLAREATEDGKMVRTTLTVGPHARLAAVMHPMTDMNGQVAGTVGWFGQALTGGAFDQLETAVLVAYDEHILWANAAAARAFGLAEVSRWDDVYGFPGWAEAIAGVTVRRRGEYRMRCLGTGGHYVLVEAWRPDPADDMHSVPMEQVASLVHEIRNPLAALSGYVEMAQMDADPQTPNYYGEMMQEIDRLSRFTTDLMAVARPMTIQPTWVKIDDLVEHAWFSARRGKRPGRPAVMLTKHYDLGQCLWMDPDRAQQVMSNLVKNAVEAMHTEGSRVSIAYGETESEVVLTVADDGPGLPAEMLNRVFVSRVTTKDFGNGFGLLIVRRIAEAHGGTVRVTVNQETRIEIILPRARH